MSESTDRAKRETLLNAMRNGAAALRTVAERSELQGYPDDAAHDREQAAILEAAALAPTAAPEAPTAPARQPGADAELVERLNALFAFLDGSGPLRGCWFGERPPDMSPYWWRDVLRDLRSDLLARLSAPAGPGSEGGEAIWWARMDYLFEALPFVVRHRWGGDAREMVEGLDAARAALEASGADHHDAGTGET